METYYIYSLIAALLLTVFVGFICYWYGKIKGMLNQNSELWKRLQASAERVIRLAWMLKELRKQFVNERQHNELLIKASETKYKEGWSDCENSFKSDITVNDKGQFLRKV